MVDSGFDMIASTKEDKQRRMTWIGLPMMHEQKSMLQWNATLKLVDVFAKQRITTVGLKGMTVAQWYPNPMQRDSCDFDCFLLKEGPDGRRVPTRMGTRWSMPIKLLCDWALFIGKNPSLDWERFWRYTDEFGMLCFAQSMTRL